MQLLTELALGLLTGLAYGLLGIVLLALGYVALDLVTPGRLGELVYTQRNTNAALVVASGLAAIGIIVTTAIVTSEDAFARGVTSTLGYGLLGVVLLAVSFVVVDRLTPGNLGAMVADRERHPAVYITMAAHLAVGAIVAAAIS
ncbi:MAG: DUF350 domain-containing protein [Actinomycetota bacterium]|nr:DUF350 domain-containing protein [Actinomycetota bacterium]